jgi:hypothetical protein
MRRMVVAVMALVVLVVLMVLSLRQDASGQTAIGQSCVQTTAGNLILSPAENRAHMGTDGSAVIEAFPKKITLAEDLPGATLVCRETETGSACRTIAQLFPGK